MRHIFLLFIVLILAACGGGATETLSEDTIQTAIAQETWKWYSNSEAGISFQYPEFLTIQTDTNKDRGPSGELIITTTVTATSSNPTVVIIVRIIEDPLRDQMFPDQYPPTEDLFRILIVSELSGLNYADTESNKSAIIQASDNTRITTIDGHHAAIYTLGLDNREMGHLYIRGALVITEVRDISLYVFGSDEPDAPGSVPAAFVNNLWSTFVETITISY